MLFSTIFAIVLVVKMCVDFLAALHLLDLKPFITEEYITDKDKLDFIKNYILVIEPEVERVKGLLNKIVSLAVPATFLHCFQIKKTRLEVMKLKKEAEEERKKNRTHILLPPEFK